MDIASSLIIILIATAVSIISGIVILEILDAYHRSLQDESLS